MNGIVALILGGLAAVLTIYFAIGTGFAVAYSRWAKKVAAVHGADFPHLLGKMENSKCPQNLTLTRSKESRPKRSTMCRRADRRMTTIVLDHNRPPRLVRSRLRRSRSAFRTGAPTAT